MTRARSAVRVFVGATMGLLAATSARAASLQQVSNWGSSGMPSDVSMYVYVPNNVATNPPILTLIHYCGGTASAVFGQAQSGGLVSAADQYGFIMVVPSSGRCWDVVSDKTRKRDNFGDSHAIRQMVKYAVSTYKANADRVYATGDSSGGMMTELLLALYPDVFKAGAAFAGMPAGCRGSSESGSGGGYSNACAGGSVSHTAQEWGDLVRSFDSGYTGHRPRVQLFHGDADTTIRYANHTEAIKEWTNVLGLNTSPTTTDSGVQLGNHQATRQRWKNSCGYVTLDAFTSIGGDHGPSDALFKSQYVIPFLGLDVTGPTDPEIAQCGGADTIPPSAPTGLSAPSKTSTSVSLTWTASTDNVAVSGYYVYSGSTQVATSSTTSATVAGLSASTTYTFTVKAFDGAANLSTASAALAVTTAAPGSAPVSVNAGGATAGDFVADAYFSGGSTYSSTGTIDTSLITGSVPPQAVFQSERYGEFTYTIPGFKAGGACSVTLFFAESYLTAAGQRLFDVAINGASALAAFDIFTAAGGANKAIGKTFSTAADASGQVAIQYTKGASGVENPKVCVITVAPISNPTCSASPSAPSGLTAAATSTSQIRLTWNAVAPPSNCSVTYSVFRGSTQVATGLTSASFTDSNLAAGTTYSYTVSAVDAVGSSAASSTASATTQTAPDTQPPSAPSNLAAANVGTSTVTLAWTASTDNAGVSGYDILRAGSVIGSSNTTSATVSNLTPGTTYSFSVRARDSVGNLSATSNTVTVTTLPTQDITPPSVPSNLAWTNDGATVTMTWGASTDDFGLVGYDLYFGNFYLGAFSDTVVSLIGFKAGTPYNFTVKARDAAGNTSLASNQITVLLTGGQDTTPPTAPTNVVGSNATSNSATLSWKASTDDVGVVVYQVFANGTLGATTTSTSATVMGPVSGTVYTVKAIDAAGNVSPPSAGITITLL